MFDRLAERAKSLALAQAKRLTRDSDDDVEDIAEQLASLVDFSEAEAAELVQSVANDNARKMRRALRAVRPDDDAKSLALAIPELAPKDARKLANQAAKQIRGIADSVAKRIAPAVAAGVSKGIRAEELAKELERRLGIEKQAAKRLAVGQVIRINSAVTEQRHKALGVEEYTWRAVADGNARKWHAKLNGTRQRYDSPPVGGGGGPKDRGNPGSADVCRCQGLPIFPPSPPASKPPESATVKTAKRKPAQLKPVAAPKAAPALPQAIPAPAPPPPPVAVPPPVPAPVAKAPAAPALSKAAAEKKAAAAEAKAKAAAEKKSKAEADKKAREAAKKAKAEAAKKARARQRDRAEIERIEELRRLQRAGDLGARHERIRLEDLRSRRAEKARKQALVAQARPLEREFDTEGLKDRTATSGRHANLYEQLQEEAAVRHRALRDDEKAAVRRFLDLNFDGIRRVQAGETVREIAGPDQWRFKTVALAVRWAGKLRKAQRKLDVDNPTRHGPLYRGLSVDDDTLESLLTGDVMTHGPYEANSTSYRPGIAAQFAKERRVTTPHAVMIKYERVKRGAPMMFAENRMAHEQEVLLGKGRYRIKDREYDAKHDIFEITVEEIE